MKRLFSVLLAFCMLCTLTGCAELEQMLSDMGVPELIEAYIADLNAENNADFSYEESILKEGEDTSSEETEAISDESDNTSNKNTASSSNGSSSNTTSSNKSSAGSSSKSSNGSDNKNQNVAVNNDEEKDESKQQFDPNVIRFATWLDPEFHEDGPVVRAFEKKTGYDVKIDMVSQDDYADTIKGMIASGNSPDIYFSNNDFPLAMQCLQSLECTGLDFSESIWNQNTLKLTTFGGEPYLCDTVGNIWAAADCIYYNKQLLARADCRTPEQYDAAGEWTWDALEEIMRKCSKLTGITGGAFMTTESLTCSMGSSIYTLENGKFQNAIDDSLKTPYSRIAEWYKDGIISSSGWRTGFINGKVAITITNCHGLKRTGYWENMNWNNIGFYYLPAYSADSNTYQTGILRGWGIVRGAKNPVKAGEFLRYYLDSNNYDGDLAFISTEAEKFFYSLISIKGAGYNPYYTFGGYIDTVSGITSSDIYCIPYNNTPSQVNRAVNNYKNNLDYGVQRVNNFVAKNTGIK